MSDKTDCIDIDEINKDEMNDILEELKDIYDDLRNEYNKETADEDVKSDFSTLDKMFSNFFGYNEMELDAYLENLSDFTTGLHYLELDLGLENIDQAKMMKYMILLNNFTNRCLHKYYRLFNTKN